MFSVFLCTWCQTISRSNLPCAEEICANDNETGRGGGAIKYAFYYNKKSKFGQNILIA
jgi:hypothetical protein